jgi:hypothetical protein
VRAGSRRWDKDSVLQAARCFCCRVFVYLPGAEFGHSASRANTTTQGLGQSEMWAPLLIARLIPLRVCTRGSLSAFVPLPALYHKFAFQFIKTCGVWLCETIIPQTPTQNTHPRFHSNCYDHIVKHMQNNKNG